MFLYSVLSCFNTIKQTIPAANQFKNIDKMPSLSFKLIVCSFIVPHCLVSNWMTPNGNEK
ncbi:hypothetical protein BLOT_000585 [Blomia tropicalis]|nr:hypothetical protein BLOT_000585 [Blomia tropicalis]